MLPPLFAACAVTLAPPRRGFPCSPQSAIQSRGAPAFAVRPKACPKSRPSPFGSSGSRRASSSTGPSVAATLAETLGEDGMTCEWPGTGSSHGPVGHDPVGQPATVRFRRVCARRSSSRAIATALGSLKKRRPQNEPSDQTLSTGRSTISAMMSRVSPSLSSISWSIPSSSLIFAPVTEMSKITHSADDPLASNRKRPGSRPWARLQNRRSGKSIPTFSIIQLLCLAKTGLHGHQSYAKRFRHLRARI